MFFGLVFVWVSVTTDVNFLQNSDESASELVTLSPNFLKMCVSDDAGIEPFFELLKLTL